MHQRLALRMYPPNCPTWTPPPTNQPTLPDPLAKAPLDPSPPPLGGLRPTVSWGRGG